VSRLTCLRPRSSLPLILTLAFVGCAGQPPAAQPGNSSVFPNQPIQGEPGPPPAGGVSGKTTGNIALLVPLTGANPALVAAGQALQNAAKLAFADNALPGLDIRDTTGTPAGATAAAQAAIAAGDGLILGPLTSAEAQAVAPIALAAGVNLLPFSNDGELAAPGIWPLGITPTQQVQRVMQEAQAAGHTELAALLPDDDFGHRLAQAITAEATTLNEPAPQIGFYQDGNDSSINQATNQIADFADRGQALEDKIKKAQELGTSAGRALARTLQHQPIPPPPFNALFIGATDQSTLVELANYLPYYYVQPPQVQLLGPAFWSSLAPALANQQVFLGAQYAAPDPTSAAAFDATYTATYGAPPPGIADVGYDAAMLAKAAYAAGGFTTAQLTNPAGFSGIDGLIVLQPTGQVLRALAVFQIAPGAPLMASPAPTQLGAPPS
jgi:hypothetical protein